MQYLTYLILLLSSISLADSRIKVAVVDTGVNYGKVPIHFLCADGHKDISNTYLNDVDGHGTTIIKEIIKTIDPTRHCIVVIKWINPGIDNLTDTQAVNRIANAVQWAVKIKAKYINLSLSGYGASSRERNAIEAALNSGAVVVVAAGNNNINLHRDCVIFPACYAFSNKNFYVVANYRGAFKERSSNYGGPVNAKEYGLIGTSQSAAVFLSKYIRGEYEKKLSNSISLINKLRSN